jgi:hypothetical protein
MKKSCILFINLLLVFVASAQSGLSVNAGISIPVMCYASVNPANPNAGFARPGFYMDIGYTYSFNTISGFNTRFFYASNPAGNQVVPATGSYRMAGWMAGPMLHTPANRKWQGSFSPLAGYSRVWTAQLRREDQPWLYKQAAGCFSWGGELLLRYQLNDNSFLRFGAGHLNMKPRLNAFENAFAKKEQHIVLVNGITGIGWQW